MRHNLTFFITGIMVIGLMISCGTFKKIPVHTDTEIRYIDSTIVSYKDSAIFIEIPKEVIKDVVPQYDTLKMETSLAKSISYVDTLTHTLKGQLENKSQEAITKTVYLPSQEHIVYRDSIVTKEIPVEVQVEKIKYPKTYWWLLGWAIICIGYVGYKIYKKIRIV